MRTLLAVAIAGSIVASIGGSAEAMVSMRRPKSHRAVYLALHGSGFESYGFDRDARSNVLGGGLSLWQDMPGGWPLPWSNGHQHVGWSFGVRGRYLTSFDDDRRRASLPLDVIVRISRLDYPDHETYLDTTSWPTAVFESNPLVPYVGVGATIDVALSSDGKSHTGVLAVGGVERWFGKHIGAFAELELRGVVLGGGAVQAGANIGLLIAP